MYSRLGLLCTSGPGCSHFHLYFRQHLLKLLSPKLGSNQIFHISRASWQPGVAKESVNWTEMQNIVVRPRPGLINSTVDCCKHSWKSHRWPNPVVKILSLPQQLKCEMQYTVLCYFSPNCLLSLLYITFLLVLQGPLGLGRPPLLFLFTSYFNIAIL